MDEINKLQRINPEKFIELCQMHLTFSLDLHNEELSALMELQCPPKNKRSYFSRKQKDKQMLNGVSLNAENICQIYHIMDYLGKDINVCTEGLFRKTGSLSRQQELKALIYSGTAIDFENCHYNVHDLASVLKSFLADLSEPLLTEAHYSAHNQVSSMQDETTILAQDHPIYLRQLKSTRLLFLLLPMDNYSLLQHLLLLLRKVATDQANRMTVNSLATVFAPHILCPRKMPPEEWKKQFSCMVKSVAFMIENANMLFEPPFELVQDVVMHLEDISSKSNALSSDSKDEAVKTMIAFCDRTNNGDVSVDYTNKALAELHSYIQNLPNSARKRKLIKKFQKEESSCDTVTQTNRRHCRSRSVGEAIKRHLWRNSDRRKGTQREYHHSSFDMLASSSQLSTTDRMKAKSHSEEMLTTGCDAKGQQNIKLHHLGKSLFRASKKMKIQPLEKFGKINFHSRSPPT